MVICVVGSGFQEFAEHDGIMTYPEFMNWVRHQTELPSIALGQGLSRAEREQLCRLLNTTEPETCPARLTHKRDEKNTMISEPRAVDEGSFESALRIDDDCAEMSDHQTGLHIQGSVLAEAARQMVIATAEKYLVDSNEPSVRFITHSFSMSYRNYVFPLPAFIRLRVRKLRKGAKGNFRMQAVVEFIQGGSIQAVGEFDSSAMNSSFALEQERLAAINTPIHSPINSHINSPLNSLSEA